MTKKNDLLTPSVFKTLEQQRQFLESLCLPSKAMQTQMNIATSAYSQIRKQIANMYVPAMQVNQIIRSSMISAPTVMIPNIPPVEISTLREFAAFQKSLQDLNAMLPTHSITDILDMDALVLTQPTDLDVNIEETLSDVETTTIDALSNDTGFISWFRLTFPDFANQPVQAMAKYFFHQILAPLIVQCLLLLINDSFKNK